MSNLFDDKNIKPMLIADNVPLFVDDKFVYEMKWDGERCVAYLDPKAGTDLRNKRNVKMLPKVPELSEIHRQVKKTCILDGELMILIDGKPNFEAIRNRSLKSKSFKIGLDSKRAPATFVAYDCLYYDGNDITKKPLNERKKLLQKAIKQENERLAVSRVYKASFAAALFELAIKEELEGIVAKRTDSLYYQDKRTKDWVKIKNLQDDDFVICGYIHKEGGMISLILGQYDNEKLVYKGHVTLGVNSVALMQIKSVPVLKAHPFYGTVSSGNEDAVWLQPETVCVVRFMYKTESGSMRQPVFKGLRDDKSPAECKV